MKLLVCFSIVFERTTREEKEGKSGGEFEHWGTKKKQDGSESASIRLVVGGEERLTTTKMSMSIYIFLCSSGGKRVILLPFERRCEMKRRSSLCLPRRNKGKSRSKAPFFASFFFICHFSCRRRHQIIPSKKKKKKNAP